MKKILITGNHTCGNRGDGAILRGLLAHLDTHYPDVDVVITSRFPESSSYLIDRPMISDALHIERRTQRESGIKGRFERVFKARLLSKVLNAHVTGLGIWKYFPIPEAYKKYMQWLNQFDLVIQVGGSFFVDMYGVAQYDNALCTLLAKRPLVLLGHSVGPFENPLFHRISETVFSRCHVLGLREKVSLDLVKKESLPLDKYLEGQDTAWLVPPEPATDLSSYGTEPLIAITVRRLAPFDKRLGISQDAYQKAYAKLCDHLIENGYRIIVLSTCTGIDGYDKDDRMTAISIQKLINHKDKFTVIMDEPNDLELGRMLAACKLTIGTRLHSAIISMNFGTPAFALNYEHKSLGIMQNLGLDSLATPLASLVDGSLTTKVDDALENIDALTKRVIEAVAAERKRTSEFVNIAIQKVQGS